ncbi:MAG: [protein-PII] uridylyltransferase [Anderseniella sp.]|nr:[protein-PII] uridylyltransferase [Anderseniella sp.]
MPVVPLPARNDVCAPEYCADQILHELTALADKHGVDGLEFRPAALKYLKDLIKTSRAEEEVRLTETGKGRDCAHRLSALQDHLITAIYQFASSTVYAASNPSTSEHISLVAVGGYGRGALAPGSDIDLLLLLPYKQTAWGESVVEYVLYLLWDLGFKVGHATRSVDECIRLVRTDTTIMTSVLEARYICGHRPLFDDLQARYGKEILARDQRQFIADKLEERDERHRRAGESRYLVEPDVKDGKGGMRDLHTLFWIAKFVYGTRSVRELAKSGLFTRKEQNRFISCEDFLWAVRCHLHFMTGRGDDRLGFDKQSEMAARLGYEAHAGLKSVERFMKHYFLVAKDVGDLTRIMSAVLEAQQIKQVPSMSELFERFGWRSIKLDDEGIFKIETGRISAVDETLFVRDPVSIIRLFRVAEHNNLSIHPTTLQLVRRSRRAIDKQMRADPVANELFLDILTKSRDPEAVLRRMSEAGVLGRFIPEFGRITALMQFNMYHHYTVDEHLIRAVGILSKIDQGLLKQDHPVSSGIIQGVVSRRVLYVAVLLHDIAKGRKEDHSIAGAKVAGTLCPRLGLSKSETETVVWLVRHHLLMSETAQMRDLSDYKTITDFADIVQSPERLRLLLILTVVDIRAVGPGVWNGWKGQLLRTLYAETEPHLSGGHTSISRIDRIEAAKMALTGALSDWDAADMSAYLERHYDAYWYTVDLDHQVMDAKLLARAEAAKETVAFDVRTDNFKSITEITVYVPDHPRLLALLTGACAAGGANIVGAKIFTTADGMALDTLLIQREFEDADDEHRRIDRILDLMRQAFAGKIQLRKAVAEASRPKGRIKAFTVEPQVIVSNDTSNRFTVIEVAGLDRLGLLFKLTDSLFRLNLDIASAQITTFGERAVDVFYVTDLIGQKITSQTRLQSIEESLLDVLVAGRKQEVARAG